MANGDRIYNLTKQIAARTLDSANLPDVLYGTVKSLTPLSIAIENKFTLTAAQLKLSPLCIRKEIEITIPGESGGNAQTVKTTVDEPNIPPSLYPHIHSVTIAAQPAIPDKKIKIEVWRGLAANDQVMVLKYNSGNSFYVLQRVDD